MPSTWMRAAVAAVAATAALVTPTHQDTPGPPSANAWIEEDLAAADRFATALYADGLGAAARPHAYRVRRLDAVAVFPARRFDRPAGAVEVAVTATGPDEALRVEVRGTRADGAWTEWLEADHPAAPGGDRIALPAPSDRVQVRVSVGDAPETRISGVQVRPLPGSDQPLPEAEAPYSARLFATRIGLVGNRTANGETIRPGAHFVALPSRRGLAVRGGGEYTVRVCAPEAAPQRCAYAPVWDVGPWNTKDDHWNTDREMWSDLPRGVPQAQSAHHGGYNGGRDGFGRAVRNPAGIDLADGVFWQGLQLADNAWVRVDYLWTGPYRHRARVWSADGTAVAVRSAPEGGAPDAGTAAHGAHVDVVCEVAGDGGGWYRIGEGHYIPAANAAGGGTAPRCESAGLGSGGAAPGGPGRGPVAVKALP